MSDAAIAHDWKRDDTGADVLTVSGFKRFEGYDPLVLANTSGIHPTEFNVLVLPKQVETITAGGIHLPLPVVEKDEFAVTRGTIIECSPHAFSYRTDEEWGGTSKPSAGAHVLFEKHAGTKVPGKDGKEYVLLNDRQISATLEE